jgi:DNA polymerase-1
MRYDVRVMAPRNPSPPTPVASAAVAAYAPLGPARLPKPGTPGVLFLIDLSGYVFRAYHAIAPLSSSKGEPTHAVMGTVNMLQKVVLGRKPDMFAVAMDSRSPSFRKDLDPRYKQTRPPAPPDLRQQMVRCEEIVRAYNIPIFQQEGVEADDIIASVVRRAMSDADLSVVIVSADKDLMQLIRDADHRVLLWDSMRDKVYGPDEVVAKFGVPPSQLRDLLALMGDTSDNIPGVPGVGPKTAAELLLAHGTLERLYEALSTIKRAKLRDSLVAHEADARISQTLVTLKEDCPIEWNLDALRYGGADVDALRALFTELEFTRLLETLGASSGANANGNGDAAPSVGRGAPAARGRAGASGTSGAARSAGSWQRPEVTTLLDLDALGVCLRKVQEAPSVALAVLATDVAAMRAEPIGIALAVSQREVYYVPLLHRYLGAPKQLDLGVVVAEVMRALSRPGLCVVGHNLKVLEVMLGFGGPAARAEDGGTGFGPNRFDVELVSYLLDSEAPSDLGAIVERVMGALPNGVTLAAPTPSKGKKAEPPDMEEVSAAAARVGAHASLCAWLEPELRARLEGEGLAPLYLEMEAPLQAVLSRMEHRGVLVDIEALARASHKIAEQLAELEQRAHAIVGKEFSLRSRDQLEVLLFDDLKLPVLKRTPKGGRSTDAEVLEELAALHELPAVVCDYRELDKLKGTYLDALPRAQHPRTGRIHTRFAQTVAATGRLSSVDPNLQNIPIRTEVGREIRAAFVAPEGSMILSADYSQIELRVLAHLSQDPELIAAFTQGDDIHAHTASLIFEVQKEAVTSEMRRRAKTINFGVIYGMGEAALSKQLRIPRSEAAAFIAAYFARYEGVKRFMEATLETARGGQAVHTMFGRRRFLPNLFSANRGLRFEAERVAKNTPIQGTSADILKRAMVTLGTTPPSPSARMVLTVHDELVFEVRADEVDLAKRNVVTAMMGAAKLSVPLVVDAGFGAHWGLAH